MATGALGTSVHALLPICFTPQQMPATKFPLNQE